MYLKSLMVTPVMLFCLNNIDFKFLMKSIGTPPAPMCTRWATPSKMPLRAIESANPDNCKESLETLNGPTRNAFRTVC